MTLSSRIYAFLLFSCFFGLVQASFAASLSSTSWFNVWISFEGRVNGSERLNENIMSMTAATSFVFTGFEKAFALFKKLWKGLDGRWCRYTPRTSMTWIWDAFWLCEMDNGSFQLVFDCGTCFQVVERLFAMVIWELSILKSSTVTAITKVICNHVKYSLF